MTSPDHASWYRLALGDGLLAITPLNAIEDAFAQLYPSADTPLDAAVFSLHRLDGLHCEMTLYFSPALAGLAQQFGAQPCQRPGHNDLELLHGSAQALAD